MKTTLLVLSVLLLTSLVQGQSLPISLDLQDDTKLLVQIRNPSNDETLALLKWNSPLLMDHPFSFAVFDETTQEAVPYHGPLYKRLPQPNVIEDVVVVRPGQVHDAVIDLANGYDLESDHTYSVTLGQQATIVGRFFVETKERDDQVAAIFETHAVDSLVRFSVGAQSQTATRSLSKVSLTASKSSRTLTVNGRADGISNCSNTTADGLVAQAVTLTRTMSAAGAAYSAASCVNAYYTVYFGNYSASRYQTFSKCITAVSGNLSEPFGPGNPWNVNCYPSGCGSSSVVAYVMVPDPNHIINLCGGFWLMADDWTFDSKAGTFIHEMSHLVCGTQDIVYGEVEARILAIESPDEAVNNADNYEYYSENQPIVCTSTTTRTLSTTGTTGTTSNNNGGGGSSSSGCFHADASVQVRQPDGRLLSKTLRTLRVGDQVESVDAHLNKVFSTVYLVLHSDDERPVELLEITSASGNVLRLTPHHLLLTPSASSPVRADSLSAGDLIFVSGSDSEAAVKAERIVSIVKSESAAAVRLPLTENDRIVVDGVVASVFAHSETLYQPLTSILKLAHWYAPSAVLHSSVSKVLIDAVVGLTDAIESSSVSLLFPLAS